MKRIHYLIISLLCLCLLTTALYLQYWGYEGINFAPCPLCILQRVGYLGVMLFCLLAATFNSSRKLFHWFAIGSAGYGLATASRQIWVIIHPGSSCGIDPLEVFINQFALTRSIPWFFRADGFCSTPLPPILGLSVPAWSLVWFTILLVSLFIGLFCFKSKKSHS